MLLILFSNTFLQEQEGQEPEKKRKQEDINFAINPSTLSPTLDISGIHKMVMEYGDSTTNYC